MRVLGCGDNTHNVEREPKDWRARRKRERARRKRERARRKRERARRKRERVQGGRGEWVGSGCKLDIYRVLTT
jgi:hypothetical protein